MLGSVYFFDKIRYFTLAEIEELLYTLLSFTYTQMISRIEFYFER